jgi:hypothetical protein
MTLIHQQFEGGICDREYDPRQGRQPLQSPSPRRPNEREETKTPYPNKKLMTKQKQKRVRGHSYIRHIIP